MSDSPEKQIPRIRPLLLVTALIVTSAALARTITVALTPKGAQPSYIPTLIAATATVAAILAYAGWKNRWFIFTIRELILAMLLIAVATGWVVDHLRFENESQSLHEQYHDLFTESFDAEDPLRIILVKQRDVAQEKVEELENELQRLKSGSTSTD